MPHDTPFDWLSMEGRLKRHLKQASLEQNVYSSLDSLRQIQQQLQEHPEKFADLWIPFVDSLLDISRVRYLPLDDLIIVEQMSIILTQTVVGNVRPEDFWWRLVKAYDTRGEERLARALLARTYKNPRASKEWQAWCASDLARRGAQGDDYLAIYIHFLRSQADPDKKKPVIILFMNICTVDFDSDKVQMKRAKEVADLLQANGIQIPGTQNANGLYALLGQKNHNEAVEHFLAVLKTNNNNILALYGLLSAYILSQAHQKIAELQPWINTLNNAQNPVITGLLQLSKVLYWLDHPESAIALSQDTNDIQLFTKLELQKYVGDVANIAIGRLHLLHGNARRASELLHQSIEHHPENVQLRYYAAWADMLMGNTAALESHYASVVEWSGKWTIGCLLLDTNLSVAEQYKIPAYLEEIARTASAYASAVRTRLMLVRAIPPLSIDWIPGKGFLEEDMEALRAALGQAFYYQDNKQLEYLIAQPHFQLLPLPDRLVWLGLHSFAAKQIIQGRSYLEEAASTYKYQRAALILATHLLEYHLLDEAKKFLDMIDGERYDTKLTLLRAYASELAGQTVKAMAQYGLLISMGEPRASYALGNLHLCKAEDIRKSGQIADAYPLYEQALHFFHQATSAGKQSSVPIDCKALALCAAFVSSPDTSIDIWQEVQHLPTAQNHWWLVWNAFIVRLWYGNVSDIIAMYTQAMLMLKYTEQMSNSTLLIITQAIARASLKVENSEQADKLLKILESIIKVNGQQAIHEMYQIGFTNIAYLQYQQAKELQKGQVLYDIEQKIRNDQSNGYLTLAFATIYFANDERASAIAVLKEVHPPQSLVSVLCMSLANLLEGNFSSIQEPVLIPEGSTPQLQLGYALLKAINNYRANLSLQGSENIFTALQIHFERTIDIVTMERLLPFLSLYVSKKKENHTVLISIMRRIAKEQRNISVLLMLIRCLTALEEITIAYEIWQKMLSNELNDEQTMLEEFSRFLNYKAVKAYLSGNIHEAIDIFHDAENYGFDDEQNEDVKNKANMLKTQIATTHLIEKAYSQLHGKKIDFGHYHLLASIIEQHSRIWNILAENQPGNIQNEWNAVIQSHKSDIRFLHGLAVLHGECAIADLKQQKHSEKDWIIATSLWTLLLCAKRFWHYFSASLVTNNDNEDQSIDNGEQETLLHEIIGGIYSLHSSYARQAFAEGQFEAARVHLRCLDLCRGGYEKLVSTLKEYNHVFHFPIEQQHITWTTQQASKHIDEWCIHLINEAGKITDDAQAIKNLPEGIRKYYRGGISVLESFIRLNIPVLRVLTKCLHWYNEWFYDLYLAKDFWQIHRLIPFADSIAKQLIPFCSKENNFKPENQILSMYFLWVGLLADDQRITIEGYKKSLYWNPSNNNTIELLTNLAGNEEAKQKEAEPIAEAEESPPWWW